MPAVPSVSPATGNPTSDSFIHTSASSFLDNSGRTLLLRGVNLSGSSKAPVGRPSYILQDFWEAAEGGGESFVGRPLDIDDGSADVHLARLRGWGYNMLRFPVTWEALEHAGPGQYDYEFMDYTIRVLRKCKAHGFKVYLNPHQDIWSRFSGGSGAPYWTLPACGLNPRAFTATQAAQLHCEHPSAAAPDPAAFPAMQWSTNYGRLASQTLYTLFFAGRTFAPKATLDGANIQDYLQGHFIAAFGALADRIRDAGGLLDECVLGWDSLNEPYEGFCGYLDLNSPPTDQGSTLKKGSFPSPAQSLRLGMGQAQTVDHWVFGATGPRKDGTVAIDPQGTTVWADPASEPGGVHPRWGWARGGEWALGTCLWAQHGVWDVPSGFVLRPDYFAFAPADDVEFVKDFWRPHFEAYAARIRAAHPEAILFVQPPVFAVPPAIDEEVLRGRCAYSAHYYDGLTLITRHWNWFNADALGMLRGKYRTVLQAVKIGERAIRASLQEQLGMLKRDTVVISANAYPTIIGEIGTPFDMDGKRSYGWTDDGRHAGDYANQTKALDASLNAADGPNALSWSVWTYCADNDHTWGDGWNMEDLSLWSADDLRPRKRMGGSVFEGNDASSAGLLNSHTGSLDTAASTVAAGRSSLSVSTLAAE
ncbi:glycoside hydrolase family 5 protein [Athelia psychrophila]|uniref:Glycoside hydrolase family 5 protein n=1 Tax=Athelia psychrophila TaxID=1759441 RepID=A0A167WWK2_9AGAM|nr:glycoside hydrolase family 5 protein [Fibularhizoctonia sp. CBS 109695]